MARSAVILGAEAQAVAVAWQVYSITHRALDLGYTGLALFLPGLLFLLPAGHVADRFDRRQVILVCYSAAGVLHADAAGVCAHGNASRLSHLRSAVRDRHGACVFRTGEFGAGSSPGAGRAFCERGDVGQRDLPVRQLHRTGAGRTAVYSAAGAFAIRARGLRARALCTSFTLCTLVWFLALVGSLHVRLGRMEHRPRQ